MRRPSPSQSHLTPQQAPASIPVTNGQGLAANQVKRTVSVTQLAERASMLKTSITALEGQLVQLTGQRTRIPDAVFGEKMRALQNDIKSKREYYAKIVGFMAQMQSGNMPNNMCAEFSHFMVCSALN